MELNETVPVAALCYTASLPRSLAVTLRNKVALFSRDGDQNSDAIPEGQTFELDDEKKNVWRHGEWRVEWDGQSDVLYLYDSDESGNPRGRQHCLPVSVARKLARVPRI